MTAGRRGQYSPVCSVAVFQVLVCSSAARLQTRDCGHLSVGGRHPRGMPSALVRLPHRISVILEGEALLALRCRHRRKWQLVIPSRQKDCVA
jgi:hypothetical protein